MVKKQCKTFLAAAIFILLSFAVPPREKVTVYLVGDSTMCTYDSSRAPVTGWGMPFAHFFDSAVAIENHARGGRSTRTFLSENRWEPIRSRLKKGDYVLIQFGHNDEAKEERYKDRYTPVPDYKSNLQKFIRDTRNLGAIPILLTPVTRRRFDRAGRIMETHAEYSAAVLQVAETHKVACIDLDKESRKLLQKFGPEDSGLLFMNLLPGEHPNYPEGQKDNTHFNEYGARLIAQLVLSGLKKLDLNLNGHLIKR